MCGKQYGCRERSRFKVRGKATKCSHCAEEVLSVRGLLVAVCVVHANGCVERVQMSFFKGRVLQDDDANMVDPKQHVSVSVSTLSRHLRGGCTKGTRKAARGH